MEEVKPKLDEDVQEALDSLGSGAEEDAKNLYEAMKVRLSLRLQWSVLVLSTLFMRHGATVLHICLYFFYRGWVLMKISW